jgi:4-amino-4-deoxy-L-arabinose transferase-like glycosyltransferase
MNTAIKIDKKTWMTLAVIVIIGACFRFYGLEHESLWNDELASQRRSSFPTAGQVLKEGVLTELHPPAYYFLLYYVQKVAGDSERTLRFPSAVIGVLTIIAMFFLAKRIYSEKEGLISALFMAILWAPIYYSQEARSYAFMLLFSMLSVYYLIGIIYSIKNSLAISRFDYVGYVLSAVANSYFHYFGLYFICIQGGLFFIFLLFCKNNKNPISNFLKIYGLVLIFYAPWVPFFLYQLMYQHTASTKAISWIQPTQLSHFLTFFIFCFHKSLKLSYLVVCISLFTYGTYLFNWIKKKNNFTIRNIFSNKFVFLLVWLFLPFAGVFFLSQIGIHLYINKTLMISLPAAYILFAHGIIRFPVKSNILKLVIILGLSGMCCYKLIFSMNYYKEPHKEQFREAVAYVANHEGRYSEDIFIGFAWSKNYFEYYGKQYGLQLPIEAILGKKEDIEKVKTICKNKNPQYIWYVSAHRKPDKEFLDFLQTNFKAELTKQFRNADVRLFKK